MTLDIITLALSGAAALLALLCFLARQKQAATGQDIARLRDEISGELREVRTELVANVHSAIQTTAQLQAEAQKQASDAQNTRIRELTEQLAQRQAALQKTVTDQLQLVETRMKNSAVESEQKLENIRTTMETRISSMQADNAKKLDEMRRTVDEKLQKTLDEKLRQSFSRVSEQLESVYKGLGEMQTLAAGVGDLKKVLSNVKTRGILGEIQLGAILEQILSPEQYAENIATVRGSTERVEYAVRLPGDGDEPVWLPIDAKFPADAYGALLEAYDAADAAQVETAAKVLEQRVKTFAKDIHTKYVHVPETTEFGVMFVPVEGLYAELVRRGMVESLQTQYKVVLAGPTTMAALLNSLQMGFRTLAIQKRSSEVWQVLGAVKSEFETFGEALAQAQKRIELAGADLEKLVGVRTRQIQRKLRTVTALPQGGEAEDA
ncbi:MAG: DNA recombination protein RmuC [Oscillospiraceae bacterium]|jgi:DNA recombination protein RmuC|nr:MAG: DNA recombination protein RmuC [Oscillospiraceae bacterium]